MMCFRRPHTRGDISGFDSCRVSAHRLGRDPYVLSFGMSPRPFVYRENFPPSTLYNQSIHHLHLYRCVYFNKRESHS